MKRFLSIVLSAILVLSVLAGCSGSEQSDKDIAGTFSVGYGMADISPESAVYLIGYGEPREERMSTGVAERLYATCVAITDAKGNSALLISLDVLRVMKLAGEPVRKSIAEKTGIPLENIMLCCSHNHCGPDTSDAGYRAMMEERILQAVDAAMASRKPATMEIAFSRPEGYNFVRHYLVSDGTYRGESVGSVPKDQVYGHYSAADNLLQLVRFNREGDKPVVLINWQGHPTKATPNTHTTATSSYPGIMRRTLEEGLDCYGAFFLSGSGNTNSKSHILSEIEYENYIEMGEALGREAIATAANFKSVNTGDIQVAGSYLDPNGNEGDAGMPLYAMSFGDVAFAFAPFEIFDTNSMGVRDNSKFKMTFYSSCSNDYNSYLPTDPSFDWVHHYEVRITKYPKGTAKMVEDILSRLVDDCFTASGNEVTEKDEGYITPEFVPTCDGVEYINPAAGDTTAYTQVENGFCQIVLLEGTTIKRFLTLNPEVAAEVLAQPTVKILRNEQNVIVGIEK